MLVGYLLDFGSHPAEVLFDQAKTGDIVLGMGVETRRDEHQLGCESVQFRQPVRLDGRPEHTAIGTRGQGHINDVIGVRRDSGIRIKRMLKG